MTDYLGYSILVENIVEFKVLRDEILKDRIYDLPLERVRRVLDIGSHVGLSVLYFRTQYPEAHIVSFEPDPRSYKLLKQNIHINAVDNIELHNSAISTSDGMSTLFIDSSNKLWRSNSSLLKGGWNGLTGREGVKVTTERLVSYIMEPVDILKIDTEGYEWQILRSIEGELDCVRAITMEFHAEGRSKLKKFIQFLSGPYQFIILEQDGEEVSIEKADPDDLLMIKAYNLLEKK